MQSPSYGQLIIVPEPEDQTSTVSINSWVDSLDFANVAHSLWNTPLTHLKVFCPSCGPLIIGAEPKNQTSIASINSGVDSLDFENVAHSLWNTLLTHLKVFCPSYGPLIIGPKPKNQTSIASINSGVDSLDFAAGQPGKLLHLTFLLFVKIDYVFFELCWIYYSF